ncbi:MAG: rhomboid family intramembrane serine protease [Myxococcales bacterium]|nr:rhomboid family intramembrane serine protease [Myxococcales bacterium]
MRTAGQIRDKQHARRFADYLLTRGISVRLTTCADGFTVWVYDEDRLAAVREELAHYLADPQNPRYDVAREADHLRAETRGAVQPPPRALAIGEPTPVPLMATPLAFALIAFCLAVAVYTGFAGPGAPVVNDLTIASMKPIDDGKLRWEGLAELRRGEVWRLITPIFVHFGAVHLLGNCMWLVDLGRQIEARRGTLTLLVLVLVLGAATTYAQYAVLGPDFGGMSGVVFGLFAYAAIMARFAPGCGLVVGPPVLAFMGLWMILCSTGLLGPKSDVAHGVGLVLGAGFGGVGVWLHERRR